MVEKNIEKIVESLLFSTDKPLPLARIKEVLEDLDVNVIKEAIDQLKTYYFSLDRSFELIEIAGGYQLVTKSEYATWLAKLYKKAQDKIRDASMETLAIIVYKQPITKAEMEAIRGVNVDGVVKTLLDKNLIKIKGRKDVPGRPLVYGTTDEFLIRFGLKDLNSLPPLKEFTEHDLDFIKDDEEIHLKVTEEELAKVQSEDGSPAVLPETITEDIDISGANMAVNQIDNVNVETDFKEPKDESKEDTK